MSDQARLRPETAPNNLRHLRRFARLAAVPFLLLTLAPPAIAQNEAATAEKLLNLRLDWQTQLARQDAVTWEAELISPPRGTGLAVGNFQDPSSLLKELSLALTENYDAVRNRLLALSTKAKTRRAEAQAEWTEVVRARNTFRLYAEKQQNSYGFDFDTGTPPGFAPTLLDAALVVWACLVILVALRLRRKEMRLEVRGAQRAAAAGLVLALLALPGCSNLPPGADGREWPVREEAELTAQLADAREKASAATATADKKWDAAVEGWAKLLAAKEDSVSGDVTREEQNLRAKLREITLEARLADRLAQDALDQSAKLTDERTKLNGLVSGSRWRAVAVTAARVALATVLFGLSVTPFWLARRARGRRLRQASRTCPRCFRLNTLRVESTAPEPTKTKYKPKKRAAEEGDEDEPIAEEVQEDSEAVCSKCWLRIRKSYLTVPRLCFPTVGIRSSGKTHMLVTAYDRIRKRTAPTAAVVQPAPSGGDIDRRFAQLIDEILHRRGEAGATDLVLPDPVLLHLKDLDPAGANSALVNLFDYSGELINPEVDVNQLKDTAVRMDGFMLFLDPTQLDGDVTLDTQLSNLDEFLHHMRRKRGVPVGQTIPVPVAVCIPKFDLLINENPIGGQSVQYIRELLENLNPPPRQMTPAVLKERSELVEHMLPVMFPGADIRGVIEGYFGTQMMFFPISSVSLFEHELGVKDMTRRTMAPFGVAEPIMWLLHMHGYEVFASGH